jgi:rod shape-determining protein MreC
MAPRQSRVLRYAVPIRVLLHRFAYLLLVLMAFMLLVLGKAEVALIDRARVQAMDALAPILHVIRQPIDAVHGVVRGINDIIYLRSENARLREENARLLAWREAAVRYERENARLRNLLRVTGEPLTTFVSASVVGESASTFFRTMLLNAGARDGVEKGQAAVAPEGLAGRVIEVGQRSSRILLMTDLNSRIPVMLEQSRTRAILAGDNTDMPRLEYLPSSAQVSPGDRIITSGHGGGVPPGIPVGVIASVTDGVVRVQPFVAFDRLEVVSIARHGFAKLPSLSGIPLTVQ